jgi:adenylyltransferase/sulfurtransferase
MVDARSMRFDTLRYRWDEANPLSGTSVNHAPHAEVRRP